VTNNTVTNVCRTFQTQWLDAIERKEPKRAYKHSLDGEAEAYLVAIVCAGVNNAVDYFQYVSVRYQK